MKTPKENTVEKRHGMRVLIVDAIPWWGLSIPVLMAFTLVSGTLAFFWTKIISVAANGSGAATRRNSKPDAVAATACGAASNFATHVRGLSVEVTATDNPVRGCWFGKLSSVVVAFTLREFNWLFNNSNEISPGIMANDDAFTTPKLTDMLLGVCVI